MAKASFLCENRVCPSLSAHQSYTPLVGTRLIASKTFSIVASANNVPNPSSRLVNPPWLGPFPRS